MPSDAPRRLRRTPLGSAPPPPESLTRAFPNLDAPPIEIGAGGEVEGGSSNPAATASTARTRYDDRASPPKGTGAPPHPHGLPFEISKR